MPFPAKRGLTVSEISHDVLGPRPALSPEDAIGSDRRRTIERGVCRARDAASAGRWAPFVCLVPSMLACGGCAFGPKALEKTHGRYNEAIRRVDEEQLLATSSACGTTRARCELNVSSIAAQYELDGTAEARPFFVAPNPATATSSSGHSPRSCPT